MTYENAQKHPRYKVSVAVDVVDPDGALQELRLDDVSVGGVYIATTAPQPPGSLVRMLLPVDDDAGPVQVSGHVVHVLDAAASAAKSRTPGMGIRFDDVLPDTMRAVRRFVEGLAAQLQLGALREAAAVAASLAVVLAHARLMIEHGGRDDEFAALGMHDDATFDDALEKAHELAREFADAYPDASPPQRARLEQAGSALAAIEASLWARLQATRRRFEGPG